MAFIEIKWTKTEPIGVGGYDGDFGFKLPIADYKNLSADRMEWIEEEVVWCVLEKLEELDAIWAKDQWDTALSKVTKGVYVITLSDSNLCIQYPNKGSQVVYLGRGEIRNQIKKHFENWVTNFSESLHDRQSLKFQFWMTEIIVPDSPNAYKDVAADLLEIFEKEHGELPMQNSKGGNHHKKDHHYNPEWKSPLQINPSINKGWCITPMMDNEWFRKIEE